MDHDDGPQREPEQAAGKSGATADRAKAEARTARAALSSMLAPVRARTRLAMGLQIVGAAATVVPYIAIAELAKALLAPVPSTPTRCAGRSRSR
ncbi:MULTISPECIES: hypothetical protein [unclassified Streptomyces]|uniref:hypothetical protein n=1 Tax=unclassified Streptomyces TaxID=2593676 RepID=UPI0003A41820|nr:MULTISPECIES: hypothetical protein [unclassified Streptomyces]